MFRGKAYPDLDILDSPLLSPTAGPSFSAIPPSALADRIFNDPESWGEDDTSDNDFPQDVDDLTWLTEELEKVVQSAGINHGGPTIPTSVMDDQNELPVPAVPRNGRSSTQRVTGKKGPLRPISLAALFDHDNEDFSNDIQHQLSKILESGGIPHRVRPLPRSSALSPPSTGSSTDSSPTTPLQIHTGFSNLQRGDISPSPVNIYSASATLSFLEWYGIYPDTPRNGRRSFLAPRSALSQKTPVLQVPSPRYAPRPPSLLAAAPKKPEAASNPPQQARAESVPPVAGDVKVVESQSVTTPLEKPSAAASEPTYAAHTSGRNPETGDTPSSPPRHTQTPLPQPPAGAEAHVDCSASAPSREGTPSRNTSRRLPRIPPVESTPPSSTVALPDVPPQPPKRVPSRTGTSSTRARSATPQPAAAKQPTAVRRDTAPPASAVSQTSDNAGSRMSAIRSPPGGPAGPRTRGRLSRDTASTQKSFNIRQA